METNWITGSTKEMLRIRAVPANLNTPPHIEIGNDSSDDPVKLSKEKVEELIRILESWAHRTKPHGLNPLDY